LTPKGEGKNLEKSKNNNKKMRKDVFKKKTARRRKNKDYLAACEARGKKEGERFQGEKEPILKQKQLARKMPRSLA